MVQQAAGSCDAIVQQIPLVHRGIPGGVSIGEILLDHRAEDDPPGGGAIVIAGAVRGAAAGSGSGNAAADQLTVMAARHQLIADPEGCGGRTGAGGIQRHCIIGGVHRAGGSPVLVAVNLQGGGEGGIPALTIAEGVAQQDGVHRVIVGDLEIERVFQHLTGGGCAAAHHRHRFLGGDGFERDLVLRWGKLPAGRGVIHRAGIARIDRVPVAQRVGVVIREGVAAAGIQNPRADRIGVGGVIAEGERGIIVGRCAADRREGADQIATGNGGGGIGAAADRRAGTDQVDELQVARQVIGYVQVGHRLAVGDIHVDGVLAGVVGAGGGFALWAAICLLKSDQRGAHLDKRPGGAVLAGIRVQHRIGGPVVQRIGAKHETGPGSDVQGLVEVGQRADRGVDGDRDGRLGGDDRAEGQAHHQQCVAGGAGHHHRRAGGGLGIWVGGVAAGVKGQHLVVDRSAAEGEAVKSDPVRRVGERAVHPHVGDDNIKEGAVAHIGRVGKGDGKGEALAERHRGGGADRG